uniref:CD80-like immunoglobulin C2-set domain-containing protein n=1 Tax=Apteryx owenii TaxID=8824 RepID=A0A8B9Q435_APTOW
MLVREEWRCSEGQELLCCVLQIQLITVCLEEVVKSENVIAAVLEGEANLYCNFTLMMDVLQVTWQKRNRSLFKNIATYSQNCGPRLIGSFQKKAWFTRADESYYRCIFNAFPHGSFSKDICLNVQSKFSTHTFLLSGTWHSVESELCSATGKPPPKIIWLRDKHLDEPSKVHHIQNTNGTVTVVSRHTFPAHHLQPLACLLDHPQGRKMKPIYPEKESEGRLLCMEWYMIPSCYFVLLFDISQVIWQKNLCCKYSKTCGTISQGRYFIRSYIFNGSKRTASFTAVHITTLEGELCYKCLFNAVT